MPDGTSELCEDYNFTIEGGVGVMKWGSRLLCVAYIY